MSSSRAKLAGCMLAVLIAGCGVLAIGGKPAGQDLTEATAAFVASLDAEQKKIVVKDYDSPERVGWHFIPKKQRKGLQIKHMNPEQRKLAFGVLRAAMSEVGYEKATTIMSLEKILNKIETEKGKKNWARDHERYYYTVFGTPAPDAKWGLSIEGHHLSLNFVVDRGRMLAHTPEFYGVNPGTVMADYGVGPDKGTQVLDREIALAFQLVNALDGAQKKKAIIASKAPRDIRAAGTPQPPALNDEGLAAASMSAEQQKMLRQLVEVYCSNMPADVRASRLADFQKAGLQQVRFVWAGALKPGDGHYYRLTGPTFQIEYCNVQPDAAGNPANHPHAVWRDTRGDFAIHR